MSKCDTCQKKNSCRLIESIPDNAVSKFNGCCRQYEEAISEKKKLFLPMYLVAKAGGVEKIEKLFDYQCEVVILPDSYNCGVCAEYEVMAQGPD